MEQKIITARFASELNQKISEMQKDGWEPIGSHFVVVTREQKRFAGSQHKDTVFEHEYSQTMKKKLVKKSLIDESKREDALKFIDVILDEKESKGIDLSEIDSSNLKHFIKSTIAFREHVGEENSSQSTTDLLDRIQRVFPIEFSEAIEEAGL